MRPLRSSQTKPFGDPGTRPPLIDLVPAKPPDLSDSHWDFLTGDRARDQDNVRILLDSVEELYGTHTLEDLLRSAVDRAIRVAGAQRGLILLERDGVLEPAVGRSADGEDLMLPTCYSVTVVERVWDSGEPSLTLDGREQHCPDLTTSMQAMQLLSVMGVPLPVKGRSLGVLYVDSTVGVRRFSESDFSVLQALGGVIALAVENARLLAEKAEKERLRQELLVARGVQQRFLPKAIPQPPGFDMAAYFRPCEETSGDYYDVIPFNGGRLALVIGDVSGHGLGPAMLMASTCSLLHTALLTRSNPANAIHDVNAFLESYTPVETFMTMFLGALDPERREFAYVRAGHDHPLLLHPNGELEELAEGGPALGIRPDVAYGLTAARRLEHGQVLMLYTDGLYEARNVAGEMFGEERFRASFVRHARAGHEADGIIRRVLDDLEAFAGGHALEDDVTCLVVRVM